jgi:hypothetical protein
MKTNCLIIAALFPLCVFSQDRKPCSCLNTIVSAGVVAGQSAAKPSMQAETGLNYDRYFTGIGIGFDHYYLKSIPLFADWRINFGKTRPAFLYAGGGYNFPYNNHNDIFFDIAGTRNHYHGGFYMDAGLGYRVHINSYHRLLLSAGYSQKNISNRSVSYFCEIVPCHETVYYYHYSLGRIVARLSWEFGK